MNSLESIGSLGAMERYLLQCPQATSELVAMVRHFVSMHEQMQNSNDRDFWLTQAKTYQCLYLEETAREFAAKRLFAFWRKNLSSLLKANLQYFQQDSCIPVSIALSILQFVPLSPVVCHYLKSLPISDVPGTLCLCDPPRHEVEAIPGDISNSFPTPENEEISVNTQEKLVQTAPRRFQAQNTKEELIQAATRRYQEQLEKQMQKINVINIELMSISKDASDWFAKQKSNARHRLLEVIQGAIVREKQDKYNLMCLKNIVLHHARLLVDTTTILFCINYGMEKTDMILQKLSRITDNDLVNQEIREYLIYHLQSHIMRHGQTFRQTLEKCPSKEEILCLMAQYPLYDLTTVRSYSCLQMLECMKIVCEKIRNKDVDVNQVVSKYFGTSEPNIRRHLHNVLVLGSTHSLLQEGIEHATTVNQLFKELKDLKHIESTHNIADTLLQLIVTFLRKRSQISFQQFKVSLNFLPMSVQQQILGIIKKKACGDLELQLEKLLQVKGRIEKRWNKLMHLLQNSQFHSLDIKLLGYSPAEWLEKIEMISSTQGDIAKIVYHVFSREKVPESLLQLIIDRHRFGFEKKEKTIVACYEELLKLKRSASTGEILSLKRPLLDLFRHYGHINFALEGQETINGYQIAHIIGKYYYESGKTLLSIPAHLQQDIAVGLRETIEQERDRQLAQNEHSPI